MKKVFLSLFTILSIFAGSETIAVAGTNHTNDFKVRFRENTLVVTSPSMTEARLYTQNGKLVNKEVGKIAQFEIETRGNYVLYAKVEGKTVVRKVIMK